MSRVLAIVTIALLASAPATGLSATQPAAPPNPAAQQSAPATRLEGFKPAAGTVVIFGYDELGHIGGISVDVRELRVVNGTTVQGLLVDIKQDEYREESAFIDADEVPELLKGIDALSEVKANPTSFKNFEVRYTTRGALQLTAFNGANGTLTYAVQAGQVAHAREFCDGAELQALRAMFVAAQEKLSPESGR